MPRPNLPLPVRRRRDNRLVEHINRVGRTDAGTGEPRVANLAADTTEIILYGEISPYWGITADRVMEQLNAVTTAKLTLRINSVGGDIFEAAAIYNAIRRHPSEKTAAIDGLAASCASWLALAADKVTIGTGAYMMIHNVWTYTAGEAADLRAEADLLDKMSANIAAIYAAKTGTPVENWVALMDAETWFTAAEAVEAGLADEESDTLLLDVPDPAAAAAMTNRFDLTQFAHVPSELRKRQVNVECPRDVERVLRDAGISRSEAKAAVSNLRNEGQRDADADVWRGIRDIANGLKNINDSRKTEN